MQIWRCCVNISHHSDVTWGHGISNHRKLDYYYYHYPHYWYIIIISLLLFLLSLSILVSLSSLSMSVIIIIIIILGIFIYQCMWTQYYTIRWGLAIMMWQIMAFKYIFNKWYSITMRHKLCRAFTHDALASRPVACIYVIIILPTWRGYTLVSPCPSVHLWTEWCPLCIFNNTRRIHFIFTYLIKQLQKVCRM